MPAMELTALRAAHGDALILTADGATVLIDGGPTTTIYEDVLKPYLESLDDGGFEPPLIDLMMVSHIDDDHIDGILDLVDDLIDADESRAKPLVEIRRAWLNSFADTLVQAGIEPKEKARASAASVASAFDQDDDLAAAVDGHTKLVLSSVRQGRDLRHKLGTLSIPINSRFDNRLAIAGADDGPWTAGDLSLKVIGPTKKEIDKLKKAWAKQLPKILEKEAAKKARTQAAASLDTSVYNLASIVCIAEAQGKTMLLTGDARGDAILEWLKAMPAAERKKYKKGDVPFHFDVIKMPHHGSDRNITPAFCAEVTADHYVMSGDGYHGNPEPNTFKMLFDARGDADYTIHLTYGPEELKKDKAFKKHGNDKALDKILDAKPWRRGKLSFPGPGEDWVRIAV